MSKIEYDEIQYEFSGYIDEIQHGELFRFDLNDIQSDEYSVVVLMDAYHILENYYRHSVKIYIFDKKVDIEFNENDAIIENEEHMTHYYGEGHYDLDKDDVDDFNMITEYLDEVFWDKFREKFSSVEDWEETTRDIDLYDIRIIDVKK